MNFGSYLDKQRMHRNAMRKTAFQRTLEAKRCWLIGRLFGKSTQLMFSGFPQTTKSRKFTVERDKDSDTLCKIPHRRRLTCLGVPRLSRVFVNVSIKQLSSHSLVQKCPMTYQVK